MRQGVHGDDGRLSDETRVLATEILVRVEAAPTEDDIRALAAEALAHAREDMSPSEIRALAATAVSQAQQISRLMTRLADLLETTPDNCDG
jgi:hypothetical protein